jgi:hypothetical protein
MPTFLRNTSLLASGDNACIDCHQASPTNCPICAVSRRAAAAGGDALQSSLQCSRASLTPYGRDVAARGTHTTAQKDVT